MGDGRFPFEMVNGVPVVAAPEEIDITSAPALRSALLEAAAHGHGTLVADMTLTQFCDSSGLHALLAAHKRAQAGGGELLLVIPAIAVLRVFAITGMDRVIQKDLQTNDGDPNKWTAEVTAEYVNHSGGIGRTNLPFVFWIYDSPVDNLRHVLCRVDNLEIFDAQQGIHNGEPSLPSAVKN